MPNACVIYHNPRCSKSRKALEILRQHGHTPRVIEYLKTPPDVEALRALGLPAREILRDNEDAYAALNLADPSKTDAELFAAIVAHPILLQRPIVIVGKRAMVARSPESLNELMKG
ncbi:MAG: arsenate reductase (glutaredoxin) [Verrucomicrobia bacterium]|nr:arsenate reductase (glutaredoxin) [Verrucomicrobiota bacterium]